MPGERGPENDTDSSERPANRAATSHRRARTKARTGSRYRWGNPWTRVEIAIRIPITDNVPTGSRGDWRRRQMKHSVRTTAIGNIRGRPYRMRPVVTGASTTAKAIVTSQTSGRESHGNGANRNNSARKENREND